jgi:hypothetical protein
MHRVSLCLYSYFYFTSRMVVTRLLTTFEKNRKRECSRTICQFMVYTKQKETSRQKCYMLCII